MDFKEYLINYLNNNENELNILLNIDSDFKIYKFEELIDKLLLIDSNINSNLIDLNLLDSYDNAICNNDFEKRIEIIIHVFTYYNFLIKVSWDLYPDILYREIYIPYRYNIDDFIFHFLASINIYEYKLFSIIIDELELISRIEDIDNFIEFNGEVNYINFHSIFMLLNKNTIYILYDYIENYKFNVNILEKKVLLDIKNDGIINNAKGYGIIENDIMLLKEIINNKNNLEYIKYINYNFDNYFNNLYKIYKIYNENIDKDIS